MFNQSQKNVLINMDAFNKKTHFTLFLTFILVFIFCKQSCLVELTCLRDKQHQSEMLTKGVKGRGRPLVGLARGKERGCKASLGDTGGEKCGWVCLGLTRIRGSYSSQ